MLSGETYRNGYFLYVMLRLAMYFICTTVLALPCMGNKDTTTGVGIFDTLFIHTNGNMSVAGDVYLHEAHVLGDGTLRLQEEDCKHIISHHSEVSNLSIETTQSVILKGDLTITQSLVIEGGILDTRKGNMVIADTATVRMSYKSIVFRPVTARGPVHNKSFSGVDSTQEGEVPVLVMYHMNLHTTNRINYSYLCECYLQIDKLQEYPPPEISVSFGHV